MSRARLRLLGAGALSLFACAFVSCRASRAPIVVSVIFENTWRIGNYTLSDDERSLVRTRALQTLRDAYHGYDIRFVDGAGSSRVIRVEDAPLSRDPRSMMAFGAVGATYPVATFSSVRFDVLGNAELTAVHRPDVLQCGKTIRELLEGLGRGVGATAAHELGHQAGMFRFVRDTRCSDCFDGTSTSYEHFFGVKHWSPEAMAVMERVLPAAR